MSTSATTSLGPCLCRPLPLKLRTRDIKLAKLNGRHRLGPALSKIQATSPEPNDLFRYARVISPPAATMGGNGASVVSRQSLRRDVGSACPSCLSLVRRSRESSILRS